LPGPIAGDANQLALCHCRRGWHLPFCCRFNGSLFVNSGKMTWDPKFLLIIKKRKNYFHSNSTYTNKVKICSPNFRLHFFSIIHTASDWRGDRKEPSKDFGGLIISSVQNGGVIFTCQWFG
jgi:hypothetical protein